jgi:hypothetical protein
LLVAINNSFGSTGRIWPPVFAQIVSADSA